MQYLCTYDSPIGRMTMASDGNGLNGLWFDGQKFDRLSLKGETEQRTLPVFEQTAEWLDAYFAGDILPVDLPLDPGGSEFRLQTAREMLGVLPGRLITYGEIAKAIAAGRGVPRLSAQAVGGAVGHNPISIIIPCHRVVASDGSLTGYAGGLWRKKWLLEHEGITITERGNRYYAAGSEGGVCP